MSITFEEFIGNVNWYEHLNWDEIKLCMQKAEETVYTMLDLKGDYDIDCIRGFERTFPSEALSKRKATPLGYIKKRNTLRFSMKTCVPGCAAPMDLRYRPTPTLYKNKL